MKNIHPFFILFLITLGCFALSYVEETFLNIHSWVVYIHWMAIPIYMAYILFKDNK